MMRFPRPLVFLLLAALACGGGSSAPTADVPATCAGPEGLYADASCRELAPGLRAYSPRYPLWADGAEKERYVRLPEGAVIDTADPDNWIFPVGTTFYKTFLRDGKRLETRVLKKITPGTGFAVWDIQTYGWQADQRAATNMTTDDSCPDCAARRQNVLGTSHVIPDGTQCRECHRAALDIVNGFSAIQLNHSATPLSLKGLVDERRLSQPANMVAEAVVPGDRTTEQALGYLHANCGHCHRSASKADGECKTPACLTGLLTSVQVGTARVDDTDLYRTAIGRRSIYRQLVPDVSCRISGGHPTESVLFLRMNTRDPSGRKPMPKLGTKEVDPFGVAAIRAFIEGLPSGTTDCAMP